MFLGGLGWVRVQRNVFQVSSRSFLLKNGGVLGWPGQDGITWVHFNLPWICLKPRKIINKRPLRKAQNKKSNNNNS